MKKIILISFITLFSCETKKEIDNCACKFNLDTILNKNNPEFEKYLKFYDKETLNVCVEEYKKNDEKEVVTFENIYNFYNRKCPNYDLNIEQNIRK